ncbi:MAG: hypothetical protein JKY47_00895 [Thalassospira sp.]|uniref:hypothetical protein n=1 Tax=unclassified Thalassospira TaxID=2648997 RepID=UPI000D8CBAA3|nr:MULTISPECIES: hypothetical protein [unclassified Thalassospira]MBL4839369.1 hypothetical protein [Thalassospira sp.]PXX36255.1 hypothetical protein C7967_101648 [Thalassospira sp. 11-3]QPL37458.1 hypothetical protein IT971_09295 [Thalassospira sp. B30-1]
MPIPVKTANPYHCAEHDMARVMHVSTQGYSVLCCPLCAVDTAEFRPGETACTMPDLRAYTGKLNEAHDRAVRV